MKLRPRGGSITIRSIFFARLILDKIATMRFDKVHNIIIENYY